MADDQKPKIASIDELVNELTKKSGNPPPSPTGPSNPAPAPKPAAPAPTKPPVSGFQGQPEIPKPKFTPPPPPQPPVPPRPAPSSPPAPQTTPVKPPAQQPQGAAPIKEYQSSIRTMKEDISTLKQGQKPAGVDFPRRIETPAPAPAPAPKPAAPQPTQQFKVPSVNLGQAQRTGPLPQEKRPPSPPAPTPAPAPQKTQIYAPPAPPSEAIPGGNRRLYMLIAGAAVLFGVLYWFLILRQPVEIVEETPVPTPTATQAPVQKLSEIFPVLDVIVTVDPADLTGSLKDGVNNMTVDGGTFRRLTVREDGSAVTWMGFVPVPQQMLDALSADSLVMAYGQKEIFNQAGQVNPSAPTEERLVVIAEVRDQSFASQGLGIWESTLVADLQNLFALEPAKQSNQEFLNNNYQGTAIRYKNFPNPDRSIDYSLVSAANGRSYVVLTNSRESMFAVIDVLRGLVTLSPAQTESPSPTALPSPSPSPTVSPTP